MLCQDKHSQTLSNLVKAADLVKAEAERLMKNKEPMDPLSVHFAQMDEFAGSTPGLNAIDLHSWIVVIGATCHIYADITLFTTYSTTTHVQSIHLPDGTKKLVKHVGNIQLSNKITLAHVLHIPNFTVNLLSVSHLCNSVPVKFEFLKYTAYCRTK